MNNIAALIVKCWRGFDVAVIAGFIFATGADGGFLTKENMAVAVAAAVAGLH